MADIKTLVFRIQSDFSDAKSGLDSFLDNFKKLDTLGQDFGKRIESSITAAFRAAGSGAPIIDADKLLPARVFEQNAKSIQTSLEGVYADLLKVDKALSDSDQGFDTFNKARDQIDGMLQEIEKLDNLAPQAAKSMNQFLKADDLNAASDTVRKFTGDITKSFDDIQARMEKLNNMPEVRFAAGLEEFDQQAKDATAALDILTGGFQKLIEQESKLEGSSLTRALNPEGLDRFNTALNSIDGSLQKAQDQLAKFLELSNKLGVGSSVKDIEAANKAYQDYAATIDKVAVAEKNAAASGNTIGSFSALKSIMGDLTIQSGLLAAGFFGWFTVIQSGVGLIKEVVSLGAEWQSTMQTVQNATGASAETMNRLSESARSLAKETGQGAVEIANAYKQAIQELGDYGRAQAAVNAGTTDAVATQGKVADATKGLAIILKDYNIAASETDKVNNQLFAGFQHSGETIGQFTDHVAGGAGIASRFNIPLQDMIGLIAGLDSALGPAGSSINSLTQLIQRLEAPGEKFLADLQQIDPALSSAFSKEAIEAPGGLARAMQAALEVNEKLPGSLRDLAGPIGNEKDLFVLTGDAIKTTQQVMKEQADVAAGKSAPANDAAAASLKTLSSQADQLKQNWDDLLRTMGQSTGGPLTGLVGLLKDIVKGGGDGVKELNQLSDAIKNGDWNLVIRMTLQDNKTFNDNIQGGNADLRAKMREVVRQDLDGVAAGVKEGGKSADDVQAAATEVTSKISSAVTTIAKGLEDALKLLAEAKGLKIPDNIEELIKPVAETLKKVYDATANVFQATPTSNTKNIDLVVKSVDDTLKAMSDLVKLFTDFPNVDLSSQGDRITAMVNSMVEINKKVSDAFDKANTDVGKTALNGEISKSIDEEVKMLKDVAGLYKEMAGVSLEQPEGTFEKLAATAEKIQKLVEPLGETGKNTGDGLKETAQVIAAQATMLKDIAGLYKEMSGVNLGQPDSAFQTLAAQAGKINRLVTPLGELDKDTGDRLSEMAQTVAHQATALKDVAGLDKEMSGVDLGQPDGSFQTLATQAANIHRLVTPLGGLSKESGDALSAMAEVVGRQATALKDVAGLYKEMAGVDLAQPDSNIEQLARTAEHINKAFPEGALSDAAGKGLSAFAEVIGKQATALKDAAGMLKAMAEIDVPDDSIGDKIDAVITVAGKVMEDFNDRLRQFQGTSTQSDEAHKFADQVGAAVKAVGEAAKAIGDIGNIGDVNEDALNPKIDSIINIIKSSMEYFDTQLKDLQHDPKLDAIAKDADEVMKGIGSAAKAIADISAMPNISDGQIRSAVDKIVKVMKQALEYFEQQIQGMQHDPKLQGIAKDAGEVMKAVNDALKVFEDFGSGKGMKIDKAGIADAIDEAINATKYFISAIQSSGIDEGALAQANRFAETITHIFEAIDKIKKAEGQNSQAGGAGQGIGDAEGQIRKLRGVVNAMQQTGGGPDNAVIAGFHALGPIPPAPGQLTQSQATGIQKEAEHFVPQHPAGIPRAPSVSPHRDELVGPRQLPPEQGPKGKDQGETTLNVDIIMDGDTLAKSMGNKMFNNQTLRANLVPARTS